MSDDPLIKRLTQLTPTGSGLDRDALLFAAGRASARPNRTWPALAGVMAAAQLVTLTLLLWPRELAPAPAPAKDAAPIASVAAPPAPIPVWTGAWTQRERLIDAEGNLAPPEAIELTSPSLESLHAFGPLPPELLQ